MPGLQIPGVPPEPLPVIIDNQVLRDEEGQVWIVHIVANTGGVAMAWLQPNDALNVMNELAMAIKEARDLPQLVVAKTIPNGPHSPGGD